MRVRRVVCAAFLLIAVLGIGHVLLQVGRIAVHVRLIGSWGKIGLNAQGKLRHVYQGPDRWTTLAEDEVQGRQMEFKLGAEEKTSWATVRSLESLSWHGANTPLAKERCTRLEGSPWGRVLRAGPTFYLYFVRTEALTWELRRYQVGEIPLKLASSTPLHGVRADATMHDRGGRGLVIDDEYFEFSDDTAVQVRVRLPRSVNDATCTAYFDSQIMFVWKQASVRPDWMDLTLFRLPEGIERTVTLEPELSADRVLAGAFGVMAALRPPLLNVYSTLSADRVAGPNSRSAWFRWWWRDPFLVAGANKLWTGVGLLVAAVCAWFARRAVRRRGLSRWWIAGVFLLGPMGLIWMRCTVPWVAIENGRAVNIGEWPEPERNGTEVFA